MVTTLYLVRHCEGEGNINNTFQGQIDQDITEKGQMQLDLLSERFKSLEFDVIYSSPLKRAYKTAVAVNKYHNAEIIVNPSFAEIDGGEYEGKKWEELPVLFPDTYDLWKNNFSNFRTANGESMAQVYSRVSEGIVRVVEQNKGKSVVIASHGCAIRNMCCFMRGIGLERIAECHWVDNTGICCYHALDNGKFEEVFFNDISHLEGAAGAEPHRMFWRKGE